MKLKIFVAASLLGTAFCGAQGTLVYDQQSTNAIDAGAFISQTPVGQSFTPTFTSIGFVDFYLSDAATASTIAVNIRSGSITGSLLGTTMPTTLAPSSTAFYDFLFSSPISLTPGTKYYLEPVLVSGGNSSMSATFIQYTGGDAIISGSTFTDRDFLFREGIVVPEPSSASLLLGGGGLLFWRLRWQRKT